MNSGADFPGTGKTGLLQPPSWDGLAVLVGVWQEPHERLVGAAPSLLRHIVTAATDAPELVPFLKTLAGVTGSAVKEETLLLQGALHGQEGAELPLVVKIGNNPNF